MENLPKRPLEIFWEGLRAAAHSQLEEFMLKLPCLDCHWMGFVPCHYLSQSATQMLSSSTKRNSTKVDLPSPELLGNESFIS